MEKNDNSKLKGQLKEKAQGGQKGKSPAATINDYLQKMKPELERALPRHMDADRLARIALTTIRTNPKLLECNIPSLMGAVVQSAQLGLEPGLLGHCYLVPFRNNKQNTTDVQFIIGYKGLIDLVRRSGEVTSIVANTVYENDHFDYEYGLNEKLEHKPCLDEDRGNIKCFYAYARFKDEGHAFMVMSKSDIDRIRDQYSKAKNSGPWKTEYEAMAKKTVIRQLIKYMPISVEIQKNIAVDETAKQDISSEPEHVDDFIDISVSEDASEEEQSETADNTKNETSSNEAKEQQVAFGKQ